MTKGSRYLNSFFTQNEPKIAHFHKLRCLSFFFKQEFLGDRFFWSTKIENSAYMLGERCTSA